MCRAVAGMVPYLAVAAVFFLLWWRLNPPRGPSGMAVNSPVAVVQTAAHYLLLLFAPAPGSAFTYDLGPISGAGALAVLCGLAGLGALAVLAAGLRKRAPEVAWFAAACVVVLLPALNLLRMPAFVVAAHRADTAAVCAAVVTAWLLCRAPLRTWLRVGAVCVVALWHTGVTAWGACRFDDDVSYFRTVARFDPTFMVARMNVAHGSGREGRLADAAEATTAMLRDLVGPFHGRLPADVARAFAARPESRRRVFESKRPDTTEAQWVAARFADLGEYQRARHRDRDADEAYAIAMGMDPQSAPPVIGRGSLAVARRDWPQARMLLQRAMVLLPRGAAPHGEMGRVCAATGDRAGAVREFRKAVELAPTDILWNLDLAEAEERLGDLPAARRALEQALRCPLCDVAAVRARLAKLSGRRGASDQ